MTHQWGKYCVRRPRAIERLARAIACSACAIVLVTACTRAEDKALPADPKARAEFIQAQSAKLSDESRRLLDRFMSRVKAQEAAGGSAPTASINKALELQRAYDSDVALIQRNYKERIAAAKADVRIDVREQSLVKDDSAKSPAGKALRYVVDVTNTGKRVIDRIVLRVDFRDASGKYLASVPGLELKGPLKPGEAGRTTQTLPLNPQYHASLLEGHAAQITGVPAQIVYADGETLDPEAELKKLGTLSGTKIE
jgi:hypothetical protein